MSQTDKSNQRKVQLTGLKLAMSAVGMGLSFLIDIFVMTGVDGMNVTIKFILIGVVSLVFLLCTYLFMNAGIRLFNIKMERQEEMYDDLFKSSKATYLLMRKAFQEMDEILASIEEKSGIPVDELMEAQKNVAKVTISRSKENADALMNSNDKLLDKMFDFESILESLEGNMLSKQKELMDASMREISLKQQEMSGMIKDLEIELRKEIVDMSRQVGQPVVQMAPQMTAMPQMDVPVMPMSETPTNEISDDELDRMLANSEENAFAGFEEEAGADVISFENPEEEINLDALSFESSEEVAYEDEVLPGFEESSAEELLQDDVLAGLDDLLADDFATTENVADESVEELIPDLLAGMEEDIVPEVEEVMPELEEVVAEPEEEAEKPPMPDLSDPNKVMSPEDIAALIANL